MRDFDVVIHDVHGFMSHHPHRAVKAFMRGWTAVTGQKPNPNLAVELLNRSTTQTMRDFILSIAVREEQGALADKIAGAIAALYDSIYIPNKGLRRTISKLQEIGVTQIVLTNGYLYQVQPVLHKWGVHGRFAGVFGRENQGRPKPKINLWESVFPQLGLCPEPRRCLLVGDYIGDVETAQRNGICSAILITSRCERFPDDVADDALIVPDFVILEPLELIDIVLGNYKKELHMQRINSLRREGLTTRTTNIWLIRK